MGVGQVFYKAFEKGLVCRGKQYENHGEYKEDGHKICEPGMMHFCEEPFDVWSYYDMINGSPIIDKPAGFAPTEYAIVEALGPIVTAGDKSASNHIRIVDKFETLKDFAEHGIQRFRQSEHYHNFKAVLIDDPWLNQRNKVMRVGPYGEKVNEEDASQFRYLIYRADDGHANIDRLGTHLCMTGRFQDAEVDAFNATIMMGENFQHVTLTQWSDDIKVVSTNEHAIITSQSRRGKILSTGDYAGITIAGLGEGHEIVSTGDYARIMTSTDDIDIYISGKNSFVYATGNHMTIRVMDPSTQVTALGKQAVVSGVKGTRFELGQYKDGELCGKMHFKIDGVNYTSNEFYVAHRDRIIPFEVYRALANRGRL